METFFRSDRSGGTGYLLPESHSDFALTVVVEDLGILVLCLALLALIAVIVVWRLRRTRSSGDS
jgi:cell division protein FtsW (lipid II flippase)